MEKVTIFETQNAINYHVAKGVEVLCSETVLVTINLTLDKFDCLHINVTTLNKGKMEHFSGRLYDIRSLVKELLEKAIANEFKESVFIQYHVKWAVLAFKKNKRTKDFLYNIE